MNRRRFTVACGTLILLLAVLSVASSAQRILFIGNSYTYFNKLPAVVSGLAAEAGHPVVVGQLTRGGALLLNHWDENGASNLIANGSRDYVILQDQSEIAYGWPAEFEEYAPKFDQVITKHGGKTVFFATWARKWAILDATGAFCQTNINGMYFNMARRLNARCAPVGEAWKRTMQAHSSVNFYNSDESHPNRNGTYLAACTIFSAVFDESPEGFSFRAVDGVQLSTSLAALLQQMAWNTTHDLFPHYNFRFSAFAMTNSVWLRWSEPMQNGVSGNTVRIQYSDTDYPAFLDAGTTVYQGSNQVYWHEGRELNQPCYYTIWVSDDGLSFTNPPP